MAKNKFINDYNNLIYRKTKEYQKIYGFKIDNGIDETHNNESDAFKHTFMSADLSLWLHSIGLSKLIGDYHESIPQNPKGEKNMDLWNNHQGRLIAKEIKKEYGDILRTLTKDQIHDIIAEKVIQKMRNGELITHPSDKRKYAGFAANIIPLQYNDQKGNVVYYTGQEPTIDELENLSLKDRVIYDTEVNLANEDDDVVDRFAEQYYNNESYTKDDLDERVKSGELIYVESYCRSDGTKVSGYYRRKRI